MIDTIWVTDADHSTGLSLLLMAARRHLGLVDCVSYAIMRRMGICEYLGLDPHFEEQGFTRYAPAG
jgi:predicted nucleic acid-binding protein